MPQTGKSAVRSDQSAILRYAGAAMAALGALGVRMALDPILGSQAPYLPFIIAIVVATRYGGRGPGLAATAISGLAVDWFYLQPRASLAIANPNAAAALALFFLAGVIISLFVGQLRETLPSAARAELAPRRTEEQIHFSPGSAIAGRGADRTVKRHHLWLGAAVLLLAIEALLFFGTWTRFAERESLSIRAREVLARIESLLSELKDAETGQRGYVLTGRDDYLEPYNTAVRSIPGQLEDLRQLTLDPGQQARIVSLRPLIAAKLAELKETIDLQRTGAGAAALQVVSSNRGQQMMDEIRDLVAAMRAAEASLLEERSQRAAAAARGMGLVMASGAGLLLIVLLAGSRDIDRNLATRQQAQEKLHASEEKFAKAFATNPAALAITRLEDGYVVDVNEAWQAVMGHSREEAVGRFTLDLHTWPAAEERARYAVELKEKGSISGQEVTLLRKSGEPFTALLSAVTLTIGGEEAILSSCLDISGRKKAEEALERMRGVLAEGQEIAHAGTFEYLAETRTTVWSEEEYRIYGLDPGGPSPAYDVMLAKCLPPDDAALLDRTFRAAMESGSIYELEHRILRPDRSVRWVHDRAHPHLDRNGKLVRYVGATLDITERKQAEEVLRESEARFRTTMDHMLEGCQIIGDDWKYIYINDAAEQHNRRPKGELLGRRYMDMWPGIESTQVFGTVERSMKDRAPRSMENEFTFPDGATGWFDLRVEPVPEGVFILSVDITERKRAEEARRESEARFTNLFESMDEGFAECEMIYDESGRPIDFRYLAVNPAHGKAIGLPTEQMVGRTVRELLPGIEPFWIETYGRIVRTGESERIANPVAMLGRHFDVFAWNSGPGRFAVVVSDVTERKRAEEALRQSLERLERVLEIETVGVMFWDLNTGCMVDANDAFLKLMGYSRSEVEARELTWQKLTPPEFMDVSHAEIEKFLTTGRVGPYEKEYFCKDGTRRWLLFAGSSLGGNQCVEFCVDISERQKAEAARRESEERFRRISESGMLGVIFWNMDGAILDANDKFLEMTGYDRDDLAAGRIDWVHMTPPEYRSLDEASVEELKATGVNAAPFQKEYIRKDGSRVPVIVTGAMLDEARFNGVALAVDITERKRAEDALLRMSAMVESSDDAIIGKTLEGAITSWNLGAERMYGYSAPEIIGRHISVLVPAGHRDEIAGILQRLANGERVEQFEAVRRRKDGSLVDVSLKISPIVDASGNVVGASTIARDITERKQAEETRAQTNAQLEGILGSIPEPVMVIDEDGHLVKSNNVFERRHLTTAPGTLGQYYPVVDVFTEDGHPVPPEMWPLNRAIKGERISGLTLRLTFSNGGPPRFYRYSANPIYDRNGRVTHAVVVFFDVTDNRLAEEEIRRLNVDLEDRVRRRTAELEAANKELEAFAYSVSHDLRTPLRGIDGWSLALVEDYASQLDERAHGYVDRLRAETQRMGTLIDDLLQLSRVTRSEMATDAVDLTLIARRIAARLAEANSGRRIEFTIAGGLAASGDARLLEIALDNLFGNAVKFTGPRAEARISFGRAEGEGERPFHVRDNGVGFDMAFAGTLFGAFQRLHRASEFPGTGIGLATVQRIIHRHGGRVWAEAEPGRGATFYFTLGGS